MKWSWGWKGAVIALELWVVYIFAMAGIGTLRDGQLGPIRFPRWAEDTVWAVSEVARQPGELLVNAVWRLVGSRLYPHISQRVPSSYENRYWDLCEVAYCGVWSDPSEHDTPWSNLPWIASQTPRPMELLVHLLLLPGTVVATAGLIIGAAASGLEAWTRRSFPPPEPKEDANR